MARQPIDFAGLAHALLQRAAELVAQWLPYGVERNGRWYVGDFHGSPGESANVNLATGQWIDNAAPDEDVGGDLISLYACIHNLGNGKAARELMDVLGWGPRDESPVQTPAHRPASPAGQADPEQRAPAEDGAGVGDATDVAPPAAAPTAPAKKAEGRWQPVVPVPAHAPPPKFLWAYKDAKQGNTWVELQASRHWEYTFEGERYGYVARFERVNSDGELVKDTLPLTWCRDTEDARGGHRWHWKQWAEPRPLYVPLGMLSADLQLPVVVVEGEKCAEAGHQLLGHEFDFVSWPGGCKAWAKARWGWLMGRTVYLWPDCDAQRQRLTKAERDGGVAASTKPVLPAARQPGMQAMVHIGSVLAADHGCTVLMCKIPEPGKVGDGWDIADAIAQGWDAAQVRDFIRGAVAFVPPQDEARAKVAALSTPSTAGAGSGDGGGAGAVSAWRAALLETEKGGIKGCRENVVLALDGMALPDGKWLAGIPEAAGVVAYNEFTNDVLKLKPPPWGTDAGKWGESDELELGCWLSRAHWLPPVSRQTLEESVSMVARRHRYHPARERFERLRGTWDGTKRLSGWMERVCRPGADVLPADNPLGQYLARVGTWTLMAICARVIHPGCKHDYMLILEGKQGWRKSTIASVLGGDWFADTGLVLGDKDSYQNLQGILVYEWGELDSLTRADIRKVKQFISSQKDRFRASFDRRAQDYPRQVVFIGTTNEHHYLSDPTGNRRFWPVRLTGVADVDWLRANLEQLFAEALSYLDAGERFHPTPAEQTKLFDGQQGERTVEDALDSAIRKYLYDEGQKPGLNGRNGTLVDEITLNDLLTALGISVDKQSAVMTKQASAVLGRLNWERGRGSGKGGAARPWLYRRPKEDEPPPPPEAGGSDGSTAHAGPAATETGSDCPF